MILRNTGHVGYKYSIQPEKEKGDDTDEEEVEQTTDLDLVGPWSFPLRRVYLWTASIVDI